MDSSSKTFEKQKLRTLLFMHRNNECKPCCIGFCSYPRLFETDQENAASRKAKGFLLSLQTNPSCLHQPSDP